MFIYIIDKKKIVNISVYIIDRKNMESKNETYYQWNENKNIFSTDLLIHFSPELFQVNNRLTSWLQSKSFQILNMPMRNSAASLNRNTIHCALARRKKMI